MPYFSGNKSNEVLFILNEIKDSFVKYLNKLSGQNEQKILDIKSTKWHDDYNVFKQGMKNLDNMYINLINFAFENIITVEQAVEHMVAFKILSQREAIKIHVDKKIDKVNQIVLRELRAAETFAKVKPDIRHYPGDDSGRAQWYKNLLSRLSRIKWLYDQLVWIKPQHKETTENEYFRIESNLKHLMNDSFKIFKEKYSDINNTLTRRLD